MQQNHSQSKEIYYTHASANNPRIPMITVNNNPISVIRPLFRSMPLGEKAKPIALTMQAPVPRSPIFADYHACTFPVVSDRLKQALEPFMSTTLEFVPAVITYKDEHRPYWLLHALTDHDVIDRTHSELVVEDTGTISWIDKLYIDRERLLEIPGQDRQLFRLGNTVSTFLWHENVVKAATDIQATGIQFLVANGFSQDDMFKQSNPASEG